MDKDQLAANIEKKKKTNNFGLAVSDDEGIDPDKVDGEKDIKDVDLEVKKQN